MEVEADCVLRRTNNFLIQPLVVGFITLVFRIPQILCKRGRGVIPMCFIPLNSKYGTDPNEY